MGQKSEDYAAYALCARSGLHFSRSAGLESTSWMSIQKRLVQRSFSIRVADLLDLDALVSVESECWRQELASSREELASRICSTDTDEEKSSGFAYVACENESIVGVLYVQYIGSSEVMGRHVEQQRHRVEPDQARALQLLAIAVRPSHQSRGIGPALRDHALTMACLAPHAASLSCVVAATRCSAYSGDMSVDDSMTLDAYSAYVLSLSDPTLAFHISGGAVLVRVLPDHWPEDRENGGCAVLVSYPLKSPDGKTCQVPAPNTLPITPTSDSDREGVSVTMVALQNLVRGLFSEGESKSRLPRDLDTFGVTPWMDMGLDSLRMVELTTAILREFNSERLPKSFGVSSVFNFPTPQALISHLAPTPVSQAGAPIAIGDEGAESIAISGVSCRFPGNVRSSQDFLTELRKGLDTPAPMPVTSSDGERYFASLLPDDVLEDFSPARFGISAVEAQEMDPHLRLNLILAQEALERSGLVEASGRRIRSGNNLRSIGVYTGHSNNAWAAHRSTALSSSHSAQGPLTGVNVSAASMANRLSHVFDLQGPSVTVDTACSSSMAALHLARHALLSGDCDAALVVSSDLILSQSDLRLRRLAGMLSPSGRCHVFDAAADGYVRGEGGAALVLRRLSRTDTLALSQALPLPFPVAALLRGSAMNQDGQSASYTAPNGRAQSSLLKTALANSSLTADELSFVECHGTGTVLGDPVEVSALWDALGSQRQAPEPLFLGAVKSNIGHLEAAAGLAGVIKAVASLQARFLPGNVGLEKINSHLMDMTGESADVVMGKHFIPVPPEGVQLPSSSSLCCGVSSFGSGGTNVHVVLQGVSGDCAGGSAPSTATTSANTSATDIITGRNVCLMFTGQGAFDVHAFAGLYQTDETFREALQEHAAVFEAAMGSSMSPSIVDVMYPCPEEAAVATRLLAESPMHAQGSLYVLQLALWCTWMRRGLAPVGVVGHSIGEIAAAVAAQVMTPEEGAHVVIARARALETSHPDTSSSPSSHGIMAAVRSSSRDVTKALARLSNVHRSRVALAAENGPASCVISGDPDAVKAAVALLGCSHKFLHVSHAFHSPLVESAAAMLSTSLKMDGIAPCLRPSPQAPVLVSTATGEVLPSFDTAEQLQTHWEAHMTRPVLFLKALEKLHSHLGESASELTFVEVGPADTLTRLGAASGVSGKFFNSAALLGAQQGSSSWRLWSEQSMPPLPPPIETVGAGVGANDVASALERVLGVLQDTLPAAIDSTRNGAAHVNPDQPLSQLGIDSLGVLQLRATLGITFPITQDSGAEHTPRSVAECIAITTLLGSSGTEVAPNVDGLGVRNKRYVSDAEDSESDEQASDCDSMTRRYPATAMQQSMLYYHLADASARTFLETFEWTVRTKAGNPLVMGLDTLVFRAAWKQVLHEHAALRCCFDLRTDGEAPELILLSPHHPTLESSAWFHTHEVSLLWDDGDSAVAWTDARDEVLSEKRRVLRNEGIDPFQAPLFRVDVIRMSNSARTRVEQTVILTVHHGVLDGFSMHLLLGALGRAYGSGLKMNNVGHLFADEMPKVGVWERQARSSAADDAALSFWAAHLAPLAALPPSTIRGSLPVVDVADVDVCRVEHSLPAAVCDGATAAAAAAGVGAVAAFHTAWQLAWSSMVDQIDDVLPGVAYGTTVANRSNDVAAGVVGLLVNTVPVHVNAVVDDVTTLAQMLRTAGATLRDMAPYQHLPLPSILRAAGLRSAPFSVIFDYQPLSWRCDLKSGSSSLSMQSCRLYDRVGCALTLRVLASDDDGDRKGARRILASSECGRLRGSFLNALIDRFVAALGLIGSGNNSCTIVSAAATLAAMPRGLDSASVCSASGSDEDDDYGEVSERDITENGSARRQHSRSGVQRNSFGRSSFDSMRRSRSRCSSFGSTAEEQLVTFGNGSSATELETALRDGGSFTAKEIALIAIFADLFGLEATELSKGSNFFDLGGDSLMSIRVVAAGKRCGLKVSVTNIFDNATVQDIAAAATLVGSSQVTTLGTAKGEMDLTPAFVVKSCQEEEVDEPYAMAGVNAAHFVGLFSSSFGGGQVSPQIYFEWDFGPESVPAIPLHTPHFEAALNMFVARHPTFRAVVRRDGLMQTHPVSSLPSVHIDEATGDASLLEQRRKTILAQQIDPFEWPLFKVHATHIPAEGRSRIHFSVSLFLMDAMSDLVLRHELSVLYRNAMAPSPVALPLSPPPNLLFRDYVNSMARDLPSSAEYKAAQAFWHARLEDLPGGPMLPTLPSGGGGKEGQFRNYHTWLDSEQWARARINCARAGVTVPAMLIACYSVALGVWSGSDRFLLNLLLCLRHQVHPEVNKVVGNCSSTMLCVVDLRQDANGAPCSFKKLVLRVAAEVAANLEHASLGGIEVMQELNRVRGNTFNAVAPFIFTSPIGVEGGNSEVGARDWCFKEQFFSERVPHTAAVNAVKSDPSGSACCSIDIVDGTFPEEVMAGLHDTYAAALHLACGGDSGAWDLPLRECFAHHQHPVTNASLPAPVPDICLHEGFLQQAMAADADTSMAVAPAAAAPLAVHTTEISFTYPELRNIVDELASQLLDAICDLPASHRDPTTPPVFAILMYKGWEQVAASLAVLRAGCVFLPMDASLWPEKRVTSVLTMSGAVGVLVQSRVRTECPWLADVPCVWAPGGVLPKVDVTPLSSRCAAQGSGADAERHALQMQLAQVPLDPRKVAYLIYTSGSTGRPKGVRCHHRGSINTNDYLNERYSVGASDRVLWVSSLAFDLSIYDIFGILAAGGTVVVPPAGSTRPPSPDAWADVMNEQRVSVWNSVPALMELLVSHLELENERLAPSLRLIFMSGDWVPLSLTSRIRALSDNPDLKVVSMGGATEAAIWSNIYELGPPGSELPPGWTSVPYGQPMRNQSMYILDTHLDHCAPWVTGGIYIGGEGVADGYHRDPERSAAQFIRHPRTGERLFYTGDLGRQRPGSAHTPGLLEILGRKDGQVKIGGFRIELG